MLKSREKGIYLFGEVGCGKTYAVWAMVNSANEKMGHSDHLLRVWNAVELIDRLRDTIDRPFDEFLAELMAYEGILVIDDIGAGKSTEWVNEQFYRIINTRYERKLATVYTSNLPPQELEDALGARAVSRIVESCEVIEMAGGDRRIQG